METGPGESGPGEPWRQCWQGDPRTSQEQSLQVGTWIKILWNVDIVVCDV